MHSTFLSAKQHIGIHYYFSLQTLNMLQEDFSRFLDIYLIYENIICKSKSNILSSHLSYIIVNILEFKKSNKRLEYLKDEQFSQRKYKEYKVVLKKIEQFKELILFCLHKISLDIESSPTLNKISIYNIDVYNQKFIYNINKLESIIKR